MESRETENHKNIQKTHGNCDSSIRRLAKPSSRDNRKTGKTENRKNGKPEKRKTGKTEIRNGKLGKRKKHEI